MHHAGVLPPDAPDPAIAQWEQVTRMPVAVYGLAPQPALDELPHWSTSGAEVGGVVVDMTVSPSYTLWRVPGDRAHPANLAVLDAETLAALDASPPWPRPVWLVASVERMRYPMVWEAVRTTWQAPGGVHRSVHELLTEHMRSILVNRGSLPFDPSRDWSTVTPALDEPGSVVPTQVAVDGVPVAGIRIDVDDEVVGVAAQVAPDAAVTVALLRADLPHLELALATRWRPPLGESH